MRVKGAVGEWLEKRFLDWQQQEGKRKTVTEFAKSIGVSRDMLNQWMNGRMKPGNQNLEKLATVLGQEIYDVVGKPRPDPGLQYIIQNWGKVLHETRSEAVELFQRAVERGATEPARRRVGKAQRK